MDTQLVIICLLTFVIHLVGTLANSVRIAGVRTRRIALSFALFNILVRISRTSNAFQGLFLAQRVMTDDVVDGKLSEPCFRRAIVWLVGNRCAGTLVAQVLLVPAAALIAYIAERL
jgi:hypothetical protein